MRIQVILDSSFACPGSAPIWGGKKGEFRDWTNPRMTAVILKILHPFKYPELRAMSSKLMKNSFTNCPPCLLAEIAKVASLVAGPPKC